MSTTSVMNQLRLPHGQAPSLSSEAPQVHPELSTTASNIAIASINNGLIAPTNSSTITTVANFQTPPSLPIVASSALGAVAALASTSETKTPIKIDETYQIDIMDRDAVAVLSQQIVNYPYQYYRCEGPIPELKPYITRPSSKAGEPDRLVDPDPLCPVFPPEYQPIPGRYTTNTSCESGKYTANTLREYRINTDEEIRRKRVRLSETTIKSYHKNNLLVEDKVNLVTPELSILSYLSRIEGKAESSRSVDREQRGAHTVAMQLKKLQESAITEVSDYARKALKSYSALMGSHTVAMSLENRKDAYNEIFTPLSFERCHHKENEQDKDKTLTDQLREMRGKAFRQIVNTKFLTSRLQKSSGDLPQPVKYDDIEVWTGPEKISDEAHFSYGVANRPYLDERGTIDRTSKHQDRIFCGALEFRVGPEQHYVRAEVRAIFDGHGGFEQADNAREKLLATLALRLEKHCQGDKRDSNENITTAIQLGLVDLSRKCPAFDGTTANVILYLPKDRRLVAANVGDSTAILVKKIIPGSNDLIPLSVQEQNQFNIPADSKIGRLPDQGENAPIYAENIGEFVVVPLSNSQTVNNPLLKKEIEKRGGFVGIGYGEIGSKVLGIYSNARALGDQYDQIFYPKPRPPKIYTEVISARADVMIINNIQPDDIGIQYTDGVTNANELTSAKRIAQKVIASIDQAKGDLRWAAGHLVGDAAASGQRPHCILEDDTTAIVSQFKPRSKDSTEAKAAIPAERKA